MQDSKIELKENASKHGNVDVYLKKEKVKVAKIKKYYMLDSVFRSQWRNG